MSKQAADTPDQRDSKRVPKPIMEKRRRDRINQSLETLRLLLLENTHNEKLKNPKVEKAEILESVVNFLRAEPRSGTNCQIRGKRERTEEEYEEDLSSPRKRQRFCDGMRTCLLRVSHFIASKSHEFGQGAEIAHETPQHSPLEHSMQAQLLPATPPHRDTQVHLYEESLILAKQHQIKQSGSCSPSDCSKLVKRTVLSVPTTASSKQPVTFCDSVWRPWPQ